MVGPGSTEKRPFMILAREGKYSSRFKRQEIPLFFFFFLIGGWRWDLPFPLYWRVPFMHEVAIVLARVLHARVLGFPFNHVGHGGNWTTYQQPLLSTGKGQHGPMLSYP